VYGGRASPLGYLPGPWRFGDGGDPEISKPLLLCKP
jgi:hypothetical protein